MARSRRSRRSSSIFWGDETIELFGNARRREWLPEFRPRWSGNAVWVGTGLGWGHAKVTNNCTYYYNRYKQTRDPKWKNQYNACIR